MKFELYNNSLFKECFLTIGEIIDEIVLECDSEGIRCNALDKSHITFVSLELNGALFDEYNCPTPTRLVVDSNELIKILKRMKPADILYGEVDDSHLILRFEGDSSRIFKLALIDAEYDSPVPPRIDHPVSVELPSELLSTFLDDLLLFGDNILFIVDEDYLICKGEGELGDTECKFLHGVNVTTVVRSKFSIAKLKEMMKAKKVSKNVSLYLGDDLPCSIVFVSVDSCCRLRFLLAPRLEEDG